MNKEAIQRIHEYVVENGPTWFLALATLIIGLWLIGIVVRATKKILVRANVDASLQSFLNSLASISLKAMLLIAVAGMLGIETTSFLAILGAAGIAIGLALQGSLSNFAGGVLILLFRPFKVGDLIEAQGHTGVVTEIQIFNTILLDPANKTIIVPNGILSNGVISNYSAEGDVCLDMTFGISYSDDIDKAKRIINRVLGECPHIIQDKAPLVSVSELGDSSVNFAVRPWVTVESYWDAYFFLQENIKKAFDQEGVNIPFPTMDVHVHREK